MYNVILFPLHPLCPQGKSRWKTVYHLYFIHPTERSSMHPGWRNEWNPLHPSSPSSKIWIDDRFSSMFHSSDRTEQHPRGRERGDKRRTKLLLLRSLSLSLLSRGRLLSSRHRVSGKLQALQVLILADELAVESRKEKKKRTALPNAKIFPPNVELNSFVSCPLLRTVMQSRGGGSFGRATYMNSPFFTLVAVGSRRWWQRRKFVT